MLRKSFNQQKKEENKLKLLKWLDNHLEEILLTLLLLGIACIMILQVFFRYVLNYSLSWSDELTRYFLVWSTFLSVSYCIRKRISIEIDQLLHMVPAKAIPWIRVARHLIILAFSIIMIPFAVTYVKLAIANGSTSAALQLPMYYIQSAPLIGFVLLAIRSLQMFIIECREGIRLSKGGTPDERDIVQDTKGGVEV